MNAEARFEELLAGQGQVAISALEAFYDQLEPIAPEFMLGDWNGGSFSTGHPGEGQLAALKWDGKSFKGLNDVNPIICKADDGSRYASDVMGQASLRQVAYRGVVTATMVYDKHPIFDHFKKVTDTLVLGVMDRKGEKQPLFFFLRRLS